MMLHRGRVASCDNRLTIKVIQDLKPSAVELSFGGQIFVDEDEVGPFKEMFEWTDVFQGDFRILQEQT